jgi:hypothetical protein
MEHLSLDMEHQEQQYKVQVQWRRDKVQELCSKGYSQREISQVSYLIFYINNIAIKLLIVNSCWAVAVGPVDLVHLPVALWLQLMMAYWQCC